jgi:tetratricopeptide (TPR) repeat protein
VRSLFAVAWLVAIAPDARADDDPRELYQRAQALYALGKYNDAAPLFERTFELKPDPALLYNAAQAHRFGGNKPRALTLYENYVRVYGHQIPNRAEVNNIITQLKRAVETDQRATTAPPVGTAQPKVDPVETPKPAGLAKPKPAVAETPKPILIETRAPVRPLHKKGWFWGVMAGAVVVVALGVGLGVGLTTRPAVYPAVTLRVDGN